MRTAFDDLNSCLELERLYTVAYGSLDVFGPSSKVTVRATQIFRAAIEQTLLEEEIGALEVNGPAIAIRQSVPSGSFSTAVAETVAEASDEFKIRDYQNKLLQARKQLLDDLLRQRSLGTSASSR